MAQADTADDSEANSPTFEQYPFDRGDTVTVDWSKGTGPEAEITGKVTRISRSDGEIVVAVHRFDAEGHRLEQQYDCAPEWLTVEEPGVQRESREVQAYTPLPGGTVLRLSWYRQRGVYRVEVAATQDGQTLSAIDWGEGMEPVKIYNHLIQPYIDDEGRPEYDE